MLDYQTRFFKLALEKGNLRFGEFTLKSGRTSPYFFNAGGFDDGASLSELARCYAAAIMRSGIPCDHLFGPAYKGIPLVAAAAMALHQQYGRNLPYTFNRKEAKDHGEGGSLVGSPLAGSVLIIDDVISAGTSVREAIGIISAAGAKPAGVALALDRQERGQGMLSAVQEVRRDYGIECIAIARLDDLIDFLERGHSTDVDIEAMHRYRQHFGA